MDQLVINPFNMQWFPQFNYILASRSPRRQQMLADLGIPFTIWDGDVSEDFPEGMSKEEIPVFLARKKAEPFIHRLGKGDLLITADTIVWLNGEVLGKPGDEAHAREMLLKLSGRVHQVITGVMLRSAEHERLFSETTDVRFSVLSEDEIEYYIRNYKPFDKAGAYGIQEWIGLAGIESISGSYPNVVGLPVHRLYSEICSFPIE